VFILRITQYLLLDYRARECEFDAKETKEKISLKLPSGRQCMQNVTLWRVRVTILPIKTQKCFLYVPVTVSNTLSAA